MSLKRTLTAAPLAAMVMGLAAGPATAWHGAIDSYCAPHPTRTVHIGDAGAYESQAVKLKVTLSGSACYNVYVNFETVNGSALAPGDYPHTVGQVVFTPGETFKFISVLAKVDGITESTESFWVRLTGAAGGTIGNTWGNGEIYDGYPPRG